MKIKLNEFFRRDVDGVDVLLTDSLEVKAQVKKHKKTVKKADHSSLFQPLYCE